MVNSVGPTSAEVKTADINVAEICAQYPDMFKSVEGHSGEALLGRRLYTKILQAEDYIFLHRIPG